MANQQDLDALLERALDGEQLTDEQLAQLNAEPAYAQLLAQVHHWQAASSQYIAQDVPPQWHAKQLLKPSARSASVVPWLAASVMGVVMILGGYKVMDTNEALVAQIQQQQEALVLQKQQMQDLSEALIAQSQWQQQALVDIAEQTVDIARSERQDALSTLVEYINTQRAEDNAYLRLQLNDIAEQIDQQPAYSTAYNVESK